ncbi:MAG: 3-terminal phosphate cyclase [Acidobacteriota bacterium]|jgi:RNA 3'-terminal phosphate cyclase (ATP)|nr:3-terminal phosphate cyclase [Acidobacteriota bacterium]
MLELDGSEGEGGGQILRTSLALSMVTGTPVRIRNVRARRPKPGLMRQHLVAVQAAARIGGAQVTGAEIGSSTLAFIPGEVKPGEHELSVGSAGSTTLVLQTILPALLCASQPSLLVLEGGTHNPMAPPFEFLERTYLPLVNRMGPRVHAELDRAGFYPAGGGRIVVSIEPAERLTGFELLQRGEIRRRQATALVSRLPRHIGEREIAEAARLAEWDSLEVREVDTPGPGNAVLLSVESDALTEVFVGFGQRGVPAEQVASRAVQEMQHYLDAGVPVGEHLADQLLLLFALAGSGAFATLPLSGHAMTQIDLIPGFLDVAIRVEGEVVRVGSLTSFTAP